MSKKKINTDDLGADDFAGKAISGSAEEPKKEAPAVVVTTTRTRKPKKVKLIQVSLKLHPDLIHAVGNLAAAERKMPAEVMRDLMLKGLKAEGIDL